MIDEIAINDGLAIAVGKDGRPEDLRGMQGWRSGEANLHGVEIVEHAAVLGDAVVFVDHNAVVLIHRRGRLVLSGIKNALHHALYGSDVHGGVSIRLRLVQLLDAKNVGKSLQALHARVLKGIGRLLAERRAIHQKKHAAAALRLEQAIDQRDTRFGFAGASGHGQ